jgi:Tfp pilus assembly protein PilX
MRHPGRRWKSPKARGSAYFFIMGIAVLMTLIGLSIAITARIQVRAQNLARDWEDAGLIAQSGMEHALATIANTTTWRTVYTSGTWIASKTFGRGSFTWRLVDEIDGSLSNNNTQPARLYAKATVGSATRIFSVLLEVGSDSLAHVNTTSWKWGINP